MPSPAGTNRSARRRKTSYAPEKCRGDPCGRPADAVRKPGDHKGRPYKDGEITGLLLVFAWSGEDIMAIAARDFRELKLDGMSRSFGSVDALKGVTLHVRRGEFIALLGPSGCGKSTALNCLAGLLTLSSGSIWLDAMRIDRLKPEQRGFGMVFQNYALFPHMSAKRNIGFGLSMQGRAKEPHLRVVSS